MGQSGENPAVLTSEVEEPDEGEGHEGFPEAREVHTVDEAQPDVEWDSEGQGRHDGDGPRPNPEEHIVDPAEDGVHVEVLVEA